MSIFSRNCSYLEKNACCRCSVGYLQLPVIRASVDHFDEAIKEMTPAGFPIKYSKRYSMCFKAIGILDVLVAAIASAIPAYVFLSKLFSVEYSVRREERE